MKNRFNVIFIIGISFFILTANISHVFAEQQERYIPYPILFVSGIGTATSGAHYPIDTWSYLISEYLKYYGDKYVIEEMAGNYKLGNYEELYLQFLTYDGNQSIEKDADILRLKINMMLNKYYPSYYSYVAPCSSPKVILVTHSMGGLVARRMLQKYSTEMTNKVSQVFFLGTPHSGSPLANIASFLPEENLKLKGKIKDLDKIIKEHIKNDKSEAVSLRNKLQSKLNGNINGINIIKNRLNVIADGDAIREMRIPSSNANSYSHYFVSTHRILGWNLSLPPYNPQQTFLANLGTANPGVPSTSIAGTDMYLKDIIYGLFRVAPKIGALGYTFEPKDYSCVRSGYYNNGDGVVNIDSQTAIGANSVLIHNSHVSSLSDEHPGEYASSIARNTILQAIDDKPVIEKITLEPVDWERDYTRQGEAFPTHFYIKVKLKDYFLADIEILDMKVNDNTIDLTSFCDPNTDTFKPYFKYPNKEFLKERIDKTAPLGVTINTTYLHLEPGEFWVKVNTPRIYNVFVKVKNAAKKESSHQTYYIYDNYYINRDGRNIGTSWPVVKEAAYNSFLAAEKQVTPDYYERLKTGHTSGSGDIVGGHGSSDRFSDGSGYSAQIYWSYWWVTFKLNNLPEQIKLMKLNFNQNIRCVYDTGDIFNILVFHDTQNRWPPLSADEADKLLLDFPCNLVRPGETILDAQDIASNGYYVIQFKPNFEEYNCIPNPPVSGVRGFARVFIPSIHPYLPLQLDVELK